MHGRLKVRTTEEQKKRKREEERRKLGIYQAGVAKVLSTRNVNEYNEEIFILTANLLVSNPDIYTMWNVRKETLLYLEKNRAEDEFCNILDNEVKLTEQCLLANPKSYGSWYHRYWVLKLHPHADWPKELALCTKYLTMDDRNFHCWDYRRLLISHVGVPKADELHFSSECLKNNFSNYSAWHYRSTLLDLDADSVNVELKLVQDATFTDPSDTSAWFYLNWIINNPAATKDALEIQLDAIDQLVDLEPDSKWALMMRWALLRILKDTEHNDKEGSLCLEKLIELDPMRAERYKDLKKIITAE
ncbi:Rab geranylgeranyltransferase subunit alpha [Carabus blaptoides fortunei]